MKPDAHRRRTADRIRQTIGRASVVLLVAIGPMAAPMNAAAQPCPGTVLVSGLRRPLGLARSNDGNLLVSETGTPASDSGRISIIGPSGTRRTLVDGLPSGLNDVNEPSGPAGLAMRGRTLYVLIGIGDAVLAGPIPTTQLPNPEVSSPIFSSVLAIHFDADVERSTAGFTLSPADQQALAAREKVTLSNGGGDTIQLELVANFPDYVSDPLPGFPEIVRGSNPFGIAVAGGHLYVTDGGRNLVWQVDLSDGHASGLTGFPPIPNPIPGFGPVLDAVPTGIVYSRGRLLVALFRGVPFPPGVSEVVQVDPATAQQSPFISGLTTAIGVNVFSTRADRSVFVLQHSSGPGLFFSGFGSVTRFDSAGSAPISISGCLSRPTSMALDERTRTLYVTELETGRLIAVQLES
jgi:sugar lactone lactonase YvrE